MKGQRSPARHYYPHYPPGSTSVSTPLLMAGIQSRFCLTFCCILRVVSFLYMYHSLFIFFFFTSSCYRISICICVCLSAFLFVSNFLLYRCCLLFPFFTCSIFRVSCLPFFSLPVISFRSEFAFVSPQSTFSLLSHFAMIFFFLSPLSSRGIITTMKQIMLITQALHPPQLRRPLTFNL